MAITNNWDEAAPAGGDAPSTIDNEIRKDRVNVRERMSLVERGGHRAIAGALDQWPHALNAAGKWFIRNTGDTADAWSVELNPTAEIVTREITSNGTAADDLVVNKCVKAVIGIGLTVTALTVTLTDNAAYLFEVSWVSQRNAARTPNAIEYNAGQSVGLVRRNAAGVATLVNASVVLSSLGGTPDNVTVDFTPTGNDARVRFNNSTGFGIDVVAVVRYFRVA